MLSFLVGIAVGYALSHFGVVSYLVDRFWFRRG